MVPRRLRRLSIPLAWLLVACGVVWSAGCSKAARLNARCLAGEAATCTELGEMYANGAGVARDLARAAQAYERACAGGVADVCNTLGEIYERTSAWEGGLPRAQEFYGKACDGGSSAGCLNLGLLLAAREEMAQAFALYERSCHAGWGPGCHQLALSYEQGEGVTRDMAKAVEAYGQACDLEYVDSCLASGNLYVAGEAVTRDIGVALKFYGKALAIQAAACGAGSDRDCTERDRIRTRMAVVSMGQPAAPALPPPVKRP